VIPPSPSLQASDSSSVDPTTACIRILLVEDNSIYVDLIRALLARTNGDSFILAWADRLETGLGRLEEGDIDLVLLDLSLPDSEGLKTFTRVQACAPHLPIIVLTGLDDEALAIQTLRQGAQDYLVKTEANIRSLPRSVRYAVERKRLQESLARTTEELRARNDEMESDLNMARELQQALLSRQRRVFPETAHATSSAALHFHYRYQPTTALAGDFFDVIPLSDTTAGVLIADVMGHGVRAALVTAMVRGLVEELTFAASDPARFLAEINHGLTAILRNTEWPIPVSAFYLVADIATGQMRYANAAHPNPLWLRRDSGIAEQIPLSPNGRPGPILGVIEDAVYSIGECRIAPSDMVMLYTDGLYEAENGDDESFGHQRLMAAASKRLRQPAPQLFDGLLADVRQFTGNQDFADDVCLVGMEIVREGPFRGAPTES
jgi:serine phosphatase RsbU (regulator of sigma subunit)